MSRTTNKCIVPPFHRIVDPSTNLISGIHRLCKKGTINLFVFLYYWIVTHYITCRFQIWDLFSHLRLQIKWLKSRKYSHLGFVLQQNKYFLSHFQGCNETQETSQFPTNQIFFFPEQVIFQKPFFIETDPRINVWFYYGNHLLYFFPVPHFLGSWLLWKCQENKFNTFSLDIDFVIDNLLTTLKRRDLGVH